MNVNFNKNETNSLPQQSDANNVFYHFRPLCANDLHTSGLFPAKVRSKTLQSTIREREVQNLVTRAVGLCIDTKVAVRIDLTSHDAEIE